MVQEFDNTRYDKMQYNHCGDSGLVLPKISLGFWQALGEVQNSQLCRNVMFYAFDQGITHFDFANNYGPPPGSAEEIAGKHLKAMPRDELIISTKAGFRMWDGPYQEGGSKKYLVSSLDASLKRLGLEYVDIYYHHVWDPHTPTEETMAALDLIVRQGKALYIGVSNYDGVQFMEACNIIEEAGLTPLTIHQPQMNMLTRVHFEGLLPHTKTQGVGVIPFCPLAGGILTDRYLNGLPADSRFGRKGAVGKAWYAQKKKEGVWDKVEKLNLIADRRGQSLSQMALAWLLHDDRITSVLTGASRIDQIKDNLKALDAAPFDQQELNEIQDVLEG
jgi:L-glyceraldehyde 3-phosphate reductase